jgi:hypothetical protein
MSQDVALLNLTRIDVKLLFSFMIGHFDEHIPHSLGIPGVALSGVDITGLLLYQEWILRLHCSERIFQISQRRFLTCLLAD